LQVVFYTGFPGQPVEGIDILSLNPRFLDGYISQDMGMVLKHNGVELDKDWRELSNDRAIEIVRRVEGHHVLLANAVLLPSSSAVVDTGYVVTIDNLLKMLSIQLRLQNNLPVVIMGETGCGKSSLINQLCAIIRAPLRVLNIHGG
jgi:midasin (ATPase involved in ribosome maturation)